MAEMYNSLALAKCLMGMSYKGLLQVAEDLVEMNLDDDAKHDVSTPQGMAATLADWAEAQIDAANSDS